MLVFFQKSVASPCCSHVEEVLRYGVVTWLERNLFRGSANLGDCTSVPQSLHALEPRMKSSRNDFV
jgi:hypothetical protein